MIRGPELLRHPRYVLHLGNLLGLGFLFMSSLGALAYASGELPPQLAMVLILLPPVVAVSLLHPEWVVLAILVVPPGLVAAVPNTMAIGAASLALLGMALRDWTVDLTHRSGAYPWVALVLVATFHRTDELGEGLAYADGLLKLLAYYALLILLTHNAVRNGLLPIGQVTTALITGAVLNGMLELFLSPNPAQGTAGPLTLGRYYAAIAAMAFAVVLTRLLRPTGSSRLRDHWAWNAALLVFLAGMAGISLLRAAWLGMGLMAIVVIRRTGYVRWLLVGPVVLVALTAPPAVQERVIPTGEFDLTQYTTGRWRLWTEASSKIEDSSTLMTGYGWGYWWSLSPEEVFEEGGVSFVTKDEQPFIFPHNDALFVTLDLGLAGLALLAVFWGHLLAVFRRLLRGPEAVHSAALMLVGAPIMFFIAEMVSSGLALRGVADRFFVLAGATFGVAARLREGREAEPSTPQEMAPVPPQAEGQTTSRSAFSDSAISMAPPSSTRSRTVSSFGPK